MVRSAYWAFLGFVIAITFNLIGSLVALCAMNGNDGRLTGFFLSAVYWFAGVPGAWILWYARCGNGQSRLPSACAHPMQPLCRAASRVSTAAVMVTDVWIA